MASKEEIALAKLAPALNATRSELLNILQVAVPSEQWAYIRSRILKLLGQNGLESKLKTILMANGINQGTDNNEKDTTAN